jgi:hypothetical protein
LAFSDILGHVSNVFSHKLLSVDLRCNAIVDVDLETS